MLVLQAAEEQEQIFQKLMQTMGEQVVWNGRFLIRDDELILEGTVRSLIFQFETKKVTTNLVDFPYKEEEVLDISRHPTLKDLVNMVLYAFGKWGTLRGLNVQQDYPQLNQLFAKILNTFYIEPSFRKENFRFYKVGVRITYEETLNTILEYEKKQAEDPAAESQGLWHRLIWKNCERAFHKEETTLLERVEDRIGNNFYLVGYQCPKCQQKLHMAVYPEGKEVRIDTEEKGVYLARTYTCSHCHCFYTPRPNRLISEGLIYEMDFEDDSKAYEDYLELMGYYGERAANFHYNEYESMRKQRLLKEAKEKRQARQIGDAEKIEEIEKYSKDLKALPQEAFQRFVHRVEEGFYPDAVVAKYEKKISEEVKERDTKKTQGSDRKTASNEPDPGLSTNGVIRPSLHTSLANTSNHSDTANTMMDTLPLKDTLLLKDTLPSKDTLSSKNTLSSKDTILSRETLPSENTLPLKETSPSKDTLLSKNTLLSKDTLSLKETLSSKDTLSSKVSDNGKAPGKSSLSYERKAADFKQLPPEMTFDKMRQEQNLKNEISNQNVYESEMILDDMGQPQSSQNMALDANDPHMAAKKTTPHTEPSAQLTGSPKEEHLESYHKRIQKLERLSKRQRQELRKQIQQDTRLDPAEKQLLTGQIEEAEFQELAEEIHKKAEQSVKKSYVQLQKTIQETEKENYPASIKGPYFEKLQDLKIRRGKEEVRQIIEQMPQRMDRAAFQKLEQRLQTYEDVDMSPYQETLHQKREAAEKQEIAGMVKRSRKVSRGDYVGLMRRLEEQNFADENVAPYMDKIKEKVTALDQERLNTLLDQAQQMDFNAAAAVYEQITDENLLPELKNSALEMLAKRLEKIRTDECELLVQKLQDEMQGAIKDNARHHFYPARKVMLNTAEPKETSAVDAALSSYASGRSMFEYPIFSVDTSRTGSGREGMLLTPDTLFYSTRTHAYEIPITDIASLEASTGLLNRKITLTETNGAEHKLPYAVKTSEMEDWANILESFIFYLQEKPASRKLKYLARETHDTICCYRCGYVYHDRDVCPECGYKKNR